MAIEVSAKHILSADGGFEVQRAFNWALILPGLGIGSEVIRLSVESVRGFNTSNAVIDVRYQNESRKAAGGVSVGTNAISIRDYVDQDVLGILYSWRKLVHNPETGIIGYASDYKRQAVLQLLDSKGEVKRSLVLMGCWPSDLTTQDLSYNSTTQQWHISMTLQVDTYKILSS